MQNHHKQYNVAPGTINTLWQQVSDIKRMGMQIMMRELYPRAKPDGAGKYRVGDITGGIDGKSAVIFSDSGMVFDHATGESTDVIDQVKDRYGYSTATDALMHVAERCGMLRREQNGSWVMAGAITDGRAWRDRTPIKPNVYSEDVQEDSKVEAQRLSKRVEAEKLWDEAQAITGTVGEDYLANRGLDRYDDLQDLDHVIRFHPELLSYEDGNTHPALICKVTDALSDAFCGIQRIYLLDDGSGRNKRCGRWRLGSRDPRRFFPVIKITPHDEVTDALSLAEGPESALAVRSLEGVPVWSSIDANGMRNFPVLPNLNVLNLFADRDSAGQEAAKTCERRYMQARKACEVISYGGHAAATGYDACDELLARHSRGTGHE